MQFGLDLENIKNSSSAAKNKMMELDFVVHESVVLDESTHARS
jgi:hypothetical protein